ncbi:conserved Plasmodium protein, unknown function [Babesia microti strain RI]|uniref:Uncharacterized protein n=1 Tax=Babesia microti (strain RI) TaxID=1133968 RepID=A0A1N6LXJ2_BABMR|nr:conserved Plasmodium protein, unknown function [Babesia microti strain RI]SIO73598.1 conserved Plasmodium protein, unknown function [Babesia microti strain RI]|eukprot:XP_021337682.1 conserved Plasmodium protein, unknown function [Babesia microti strain RI]
MIAGIFAPKSLWNLLSFKAEISDNTATGQLNTYRCTKCNYTIYPAKNRDSKFVGQKFTCPGCNSSFSTFTTIRKY